MIALTRAVSASLVRCELSYLDREPIDVERAVRQHRRYEEVLEGLGCRIERVAPAPDLPDAVFIEDTAVVTDHVAVITRPGAASRRPEPDAVAAALVGYRRTRFIEAPATLDGGDVLRVGGTVWVGASQRTNREGAMQLRRILEPLGYEVRRVGVTGCLHLKTAVTALDDETLLLNPEWVDPDVFAGYRIVEVDPAEPHAANVLRVGGAVVAAAGHARTRDRLVGLGLRVVEVRVSELAKAEGGVTCCCLLVASGDLGIQV